MEKYLIFTLVISILVGIALPLALGVKDLTLIAICFCSVWLIYVVLILITTFLKKPLKKRLILRPFKKSPLSQLLEIVGEPCRNRTCNLLIKSQLLYLLS